MNKLKTKIIVDIVLASLSLSLMMCKVTGLFAHQLLGLAWMTVTAVHLFFNRHWLKGLFQKKSGTVKDKRKKRLLIWNRMLIISAVLLALSGNALSDVVFSFGAGGAYVAVHSIASKLFMISCIAHVLLHRQYLKAALKRVFGAKRRDATAARAGN